jgi:hypothetical protein
MPALGNPNTIRDRGSLGPSQNQHMLFQEDVRMPRLRPILLSPISLALLLLATGTTAFAGDHHGQIVPVGTRHD